jgi:tripartite-type tricarboxylate transporter receptor subunit TctC
MARMFGTSPVRRALAWAGWALVVAAAPASAAAAFPEKPIRLVIPYPPGGTQDLMIRAVQDAVGKVLGQALVIDNKPGAAGVVGTQEVARAVPDGHTLGLANGGLVITPMVQSGAAALDLTRDVVPVTLLGASPLVIFAHPSVPAEDVKSFFAWGKAQARGLTYSSSGLGGLGHLAADLMTRSAGIKGLHVPYKGSAPATLAVLSGEVQFTVTTISDTAMQNVEAKKLKVLGVTTRKPYAGLPAAGTVGAVLPGFDIGVWFGIVAPRGTPAEVVQTLHKGFAGALAQDDIRKRYAALGLSAEGAAPAEFADIIARDKATWAPIVRELNIRLD